MSELVRIDERRPVHYPVPLAISAVWLTASGLTAFLAWGLLMHSPYIVQHLDVFGEYDGVIMLGASLSPLLAAVIATYLIVAYAYD